MPDDVRPVDDWLDAEGRNLLTRLRSKPAPSPRDPRREPSEIDRQKSVVKWLRQWGWIVSRTENELNRARERDPDAAMRLASAAKARGKQPGFPDLTLISPAGRVVFCEMKAAKGRASTKQADLHALMRARGCVVILGRDIESVRAALLAEGIHVEARRATPAEGLRR